MELPKNQTPTNRPYIYLLGDSKPKAIVVLLVIVALVLFGYSQIVPKTTRSVTVVGNGTKIVPANKATVTFVVILSGNDRNQLLSVGEAKMVDIATAIKQFSPTSYVQTPYQLIPQYNRTNGVADTASIRAYQYASGGQVTVEGLEKIAALQLILNDKEATIAQIRYFPQDQAMVDKEVRDLAIKNAKEKASQLAQSSGAHLGRVITITEQGSTSQTGTAATSSQSVQTNQNRSSEIEVQAVVATTFEVW